MMLMEMPSCLARVFQVSAQAPCLVSMLRVLLNVLGMEIPIFWMFLRIALLKSSNGAGFI